MYMKFEGFCFVRKIGPELTSVANLHLLCMWVAAPAWLMSGVGLHPGPETSNLGHQSRVCRT